MTAPPRTPDERELEHLQQKVAEGEVARARRDALAFKLWSDGMKQADIADRLDRADRRGGGPGMTHSTTQKLIFRHRKKIEDDLLPGRSA